MRVHNWLSMHLFLRQLSIIAKIGIFFGGALFLLSAFWPGAMTLDSIDQYGQALSHVYTDWHPAIMSLLWSLFLLWCSGPAPMLLFHMAMLFGATALLYMSCAKKCKGSWIWLALPLFPFIASLSGIIWKDVSMAYAFFLAFAFFHIGIQKHSYMLFFPAVCFFLYAFFVRHNAIMAAAPIVYYTIRIISPEWKKVKVFGVSCLILLSVFTLGQCINNYILKVQKTHTSILFTMRIDEIAATSHIVKKNLFFRESPVYGLPVEDLPDVQLAKGWCFYSKVKMSNENLAKNRLWLIENEPWAYLQAKWNLFKRFSGVPFGKAFVVLYTNIRKNDYGLIFTEKTTTRILKSYVEFFHSLYLPFLVVFWIPLAGGIFLYALRRDDLLGLELRMLTGSAVCYYLGYFLVTPTPDYRFIYWTVLATTVASLLFICDKLSYEHCKKPE